MRRKKTSLVALTLAAAMMVTSIAPSVTVQAETQSTEQQETQTISDKDAPTLLITEIATDAVSSGGTKLDFVEVYNNSNESIDFMEYSTFYVSTNGTYREFSKDTLTSGGSGTHEVDFGGNTELIIQPGETLVIGFARTNSTSAETTTTTNLVNAFNTYYGTELVAYKNFIRYNAASLYTASEKGFFIGKSWDSVTTESWMNKEGDDITSNTDQKLAIQYAYNGNGKECEKLEVAAATPGSVSTEQVPSTRVAMAEDTAALEISSAEASQDTDGDLEITAKVPYTGTASALTVKVSYRQVIGEAFEQEYYDYNEVEMIPSGDGETFTTTIGAEQLFGDSVKWEVSATYGEKTEISDENTEETLIVAKSGEQTTEITAVESSSKADCPLVITEIGIAPNFVSGISTGTGRRNQFCYIEVYNQSNEPVSATYFKGLYHQKHDNFANNNSVCDISVSNSDYTAVIQPGEVWVYWVSCNYDYTTLDMFNAYYGTELENGKGILDYSGYTWYGTGYTPSYGSEYMRAFDVTNYGEVSLGFNKASAVTGAKFNYTPESIVTNERYADTGYTAFQYTYPRGNSNESVLVQVSKATPGTVEDWQIPEETKDCSEFAYLGTPAPSSSDWKPTLKECEIGDLQTPESINEGELLKVMYDTDFLFSTNSISQARLDAFNVDNDEEHCGGTTQLLNNPYVLYYETWYKLDDAEDWTVIKERRNWRPGHYPAQIPSDILFGHDEVTYKVRSYTLYGYAETEEKTVIINRANDTDGTVRLNVNDGEILSGTNTITANDGADNAATEIYIDDQKVETTSVLEDGAYFAVNTSATYGYYKNAITAPYGDNEREIISNLNLWCEEPNSRLIHIDNKYFTYNEETNSYDVTLSIWSGNSGTPFEDIYADIVNDARNAYNVNGLQLRLANGNCYNPTKIGDTVIGDDYSLENSYAVNGDVMHLDVSFSVPADEVNAVGYALDTKTLTDGEYTITAKSEEKTTTAKVIVDNTKPEINVDIAANGGVQYDEVALAVDNIVTDANSIEDLAVTLDGAELTVPTTIVPGELSVGEHTLAVAATDAAGNTETKEYVFTTEEVTPEVTGTANEGVTYVNAELSVTLGEEKSDVTFYEGKSLTKDNGGVVYGDVVTGENGDFTYQTFSVEAGEINADDMLAVRWSGTASGVNANHPITLFAANAQTGEWKAVGEADDEGNMNLAIPAADYVKDGKATLLVQSCTRGTKPEIKVAQAEQEIQEVQTAAEWDGTGRPENYDFALAWETDTQYYTESFPYHYREMNQWIVDNAEDWKIGYVIHTGDIVDDADMAGQWMIADEAMKILDDAGMPYGVLGGNHDVYAGSERYGFYWQYFGEDRFEDKDYYGGSYKNNLGHYDLITANGQDLIILYMSWDIYEEEIQWMNDVLAKYSDRKAILTFHRYANISSADYNGSKSLLDYAGKIIQEEVVAENENVIAVLNGHYHGATLQTTGFDDDEDGQIDRQVYEICTDYQSDPEAGSQYIKFLYFDLENNKVYINSYSPYRDDFNYYDTAKQSSYNVGTLYLNQDIAEMDVAFDSTEKTLTTNTMDVDIRTTKEIGRLTGVSGKVTYPWTGLASQTAYGWYASITNGRNGQTATEVKEFATAAENYKVIASASAGGSISGAAEVKYGSNATYTFTPEAGYKVLQVFVDGALVNVTGNTYTIENITADHTIEVTFAKADSTYVPDEPEQDKQEEQDKQSLVGTIVKKGTVKYTVTSDNKVGGTVCVTKMTNKSAKSVTIPATITIDKKTYKVTEISAKAFEGCKKLKTVTIGKNVKTIGSSAFKNCTALTAIKGGTGLVTIGSNAFYGCKALKKLNLSSKSLKKINASAFSKCTALTTVVISSKKLTNIGTKAFYGDKKLKSITLKTTKLTKSRVGKNAFKGIRSSCKFKVPASKVKSYKTIFKNKGAGSKMKVTK